MSVRTLSMFRMKRCSNFWTFLLIGEKFHRIFGQYSLLHFDLYSSKCDNSNKIASRESFFHLLDIDQFPMFFHLSRFDRRTKFISILEGTNKFTIFFFLSKTVILIFRLFFCTMTIFTNCWSASGVLCMEKQKR